MGAAFAGQHPQLGLNKLIILQMVQRFAIRAITHNSLSWKTKKKQNFGNIFF